MFDDDILERTKEEARYIIKYKSTVRLTALYFGVSKSLVHYDLKYRLPDIDRHLDKKVKALMKKNFNEKHIRGGLSTKRKYEKQIG